MPSIQIFNLQRKYPIETISIESFCAVLIENVTEVSGFYFSVAVVGNARMKQLNELFRGKKSTTDVLSFPHEPDEFDPDKDNLGDIVISAEQAAKQATENGLTLEGEIKQLILHGVLHLCGYDHETDNGEMNARELELRDKLGI
ncbi:MAG: rRNA maturation RNase YbeY [Pyrinomonadaceae bacterium]|nr:rRNA maturation RNase YbeY [Pyrinomonadaceae bacterium]